jgi:dTMP kinase
VSASGFFLVLEGPEGAGKSTLGAALARRMRDAGVDPVLVREPGGTPAAEHVRQAFLDPASRFEPVSELLFVTAARANLVHEVIRPALKAGRVVLSDRFDLSTQAYQGAGRGLDPAIVELVNRCATGGLIPDVTLVLDLPPAIGRARQSAAGKAMDRMEREDAAFHERVAAAYLGARGPGIFHLDGTAPAPAVLEAAWQRLQQERADTFGAPRAGSDPR